MTVNGQDMQLLHEQTAAEIRGHRNGMYYNQNRPNYNEQKDKPDTLIKQVQQIERGIMGKDTYAISAYLKGSVSKMSYNIEILPIDMAGSVSRQIHQDAATGYI